MSTSNSTGTPDIEQLSELANQLFKASPGEPTSMGSGMPQPLALQGMHPAYQGYLTDTQSLQTTPPDPHIAAPVAAPSISGAGVSTGAVQQIDFIDLNNFGNMDDGNHSPSFNQTNRGSDINASPKMSNTEYAGGIPQSLAGSGVSPSAGQQNSDFNIKDPQTSLPDPHFTDGKIPQSVAGSGKSPTSQYSDFNIGDSQTSLPESNFTEGKVPQSVAGSGKSPIAPQQQTDFNINEPQTSLPDPHFSDGKVPSSVAGSGKSPSLQDKNKSTSSNSSNANALPYADQNNDFETGLAEALASMSSFTSMPQLPTSFDQPSFYFLPNTGGFDPGISSFSPDRAIAAKAQSGIAPPFDVNLVRKDFPILQERVNGRQLIWLDNAATTQKPMQVIERISYFYEHENSNIHRAAHELAARATDAYEAAREKVRQFINAGSINEIIFVRGTTEAINLVAKSWGDQNLNSGDEIILSHLEHHANIVPWQQLAAKKNLKIKVIPVDDDGQVILSEYANLLGPKVKLVSFSHVSNALGTITPAKQIIDMAHASGAKVLLDGAQSVSHKRVDMQQLNPDWFVFSGHKVFGPTGIGVVYGKEDLLNATQPWQGGGNMIKDVTFEHTTFHNAPGRFEAGTGNIADAVGLGAAIDYVNKIGIDLIDQYEHFLLEYATRLLKQVPGLRLIGTAPDKASVLSFVLAGYETEDVGHALNEEGIAVRSGHHCAQPILRRFGVEATVRPSLAFYNTCSEVDKLFSVLMRLKGK
ncbi:MAG: family 2A encapsulin nanocompartment cargo protein cysteine desulfurase [Ferruginibacter sp.]